VKIIKSKKNQNEFFVTGFRVMQEGKWARIITDKNGEALLDYPKDKAIWLSDILDELHEAGWITEDEYWHPNIIAFHRLSKQNYLTGFY
jgi:hypothetical protein